MLRTCTGCAGLAALILAPPAFAHHPSGVSSTGGAGPIVQAEPSWRLLSGIAVSF